MNPAPDEMDISFIARVNPVGAPFILGSPVRDNEVFAIHMGSLSKPC